ncbi:MAG: hypothetical protein EXS32_07905 [Opitutus sp.]|nr:hypothetical protein [Opitutus sp.]
MASCLKDQSGRLPGKTIIFAMTKAHALRLRTVFEERYPLHVGLVQVINSDTERVRNGAYGDGLLTKFRKNDFPRIAISVDLLEAGVDVPEVVNLVFMRPVQSRIKLWQLLGRGTRTHEACRYPDRLPKGKKTGFKVIDFWQNDISHQADDQALPEIPVLVGLFNTRLRLLESQLQVLTTEISVQAIADLRAMLDRIPCDSFSVRQVWAGIAAAWEPAFWQFLPPERVELLRGRVGPLLRYVSRVDVAAETFIGKVERLKLQRLRQAPAPALLQSIAGDVRLLPEIVRESPSARLALSRDLATATSAQLSSLARDLALEMRHRRDRPNAFSTIDLPDLVATRGFISLGDGGRQVDVEEYRQQVEARVLALSIIIPRWKPSGRVATCPKAGLLSSNGSLIANSATARSKSAAPISIKPMDSGWTTTSSFSATYSGSMPFRTTARSSATVLRSTSPPMLSPPSRSTLSARCWRFFSAKDRSLKPTFISRRSRFSARVPSSASSRRGRSTIYSS